MIAVIADDFTGAAEIGGIGLKHGLKVVIETKVEPDEKADLFIITADTRALPSQEASQEIEKLTTQLMELKPRFIYKKIDSVLRGNIAGELCAQMQVVEKDRAIIIAGNPAINRVIIDGVYYVNHIPLSETSFANDKEYRLLSSYVTELVSTEKCEVVSANFHQELPEKGLIIGDVKARADMQSWVEVIDENMVVAGGAGFFEVILEEKLQAQIENKPVNYKLGNRALIIFGSAFPKSKCFMDSILQSDVEVIDMPEKLYWDQNINEEEILKWANNIINTLKSEKKVVLTISHSGNTVADISCKIREIVGRTVLQVIKHTHLDDMLIEGGATASVILKYLDITRLYPFQQIEAGVIQMEAPGYPNLFITTKPGSYLWPDNLLLGQVESKA